MPRLKKRPSPLHGILRDKQYLIRKQFHIKTDHKPLVPILGLKNLDEMSPQIQCLHMCLLRFNFTVSHVLGKRLISTVLKRRLIYMFNIYWPPEKESIKHCSNTATKIGQAEPECQTHLNHTGRSRMNSWLSIDCFSKLKGLQSQLPLG